MKDLSFETFFREYSESDESAFSVPETQDEESYDEPIEDGSIDIGELTAQHLYIHLYNLFVTEEQEFEMENDIVYYDTEGSEVVYYDSDDE